MKPSNLGNIRRFRTLHGSFFLHFFLFFFFSLLTFKFFHFFVFSIFSFFHVCPFLFSDFLIFSFFHVFHFFFLCFGRKKTKKKSLEVTTVKMMGCAVWGVVWCCGVVLCCVCWWMYVAATPCTAGSFKTEGSIPELTVTCPPWICVRSVSHHGCDARPRRAPLRRSVAHDPAARTISHGQPWLWLVVVVVVVCWLLVVHQISSSSSFLLFARGPQQI